MVEVQGTLTPEGTLVLDEKPSLSAGRVKVTVQPVLDYKDTDIWKFFEGIWAESAASGHVPRSREEIDAELEASRQQDEERMLELERIHDECERFRQQQRQAESS